MERVRPWWPKACSEPWHFGQGTAFGSAQAYLCKFYAEFCFCEVGEQYQEDNIPHQEMLIEAPRRVKSEGASHG